jgi:hypothetical protein
LKAHAAWLHLFPSRFSSANNHLIAELVAEYLIDTALYGRDANGRREEAWTDLLREVSRQILPDGVNAEQSPAYGAFTAELVLLACMVAKGEGREIPEDLRSRLESFADHIFVLADDSGRVPNIGDNDEGRALTLVQHEPVYPYSVACSICAFFGQPAQNEREAPPSLRTSVFGSPRKGPAPSTGLYMFPDGGVSVVRGRIGISSYLLTFDHGPLGYLSIAAHGHADALAITLTINGTPVLVDPGTYLYHSGAGWRQWFRGTAAHNTLNVGGRDQSTMSGPFNWSHKAETLLEQFAGGAFWRVVASHNGYEKSVGLRHRRRISACPEGFEIHDSLEGPGPSDAEVVFQTDPGISCRRAGLKVFLYRGETKVVELEFDAPGEIFLACGGGCREGGGWVSAAFGSKIPAYRIAWRGAITEAGLRTRVTICSEGGTHD